MVFFEATSNPKGSIYRTTLDFCSLIHFLHTIYNPRLSSGSMFFVPECPWQAKAKHILFSGNDSVINIWMQIHKTHHRK